MQSSLFLVCGSKYMYSATLLHVSFSRSHHDHACYSTHVAPPRHARYFFGTDAAERMEVVAGECTVTLKDGDAEATVYAAGTHFDVPASSGFTIVVAEGLCEYICSFLP
jgi:uncharacterized protein YaiE (UPF0345 family)